MDYQWDELVSGSNKIPLPHENFDEYFGNYNEFDNMINETLTGLQELDVPSTFKFQPTHSRKVSGTAIFGYVDHNRELSINGLANDLYKKPCADQASISPGALKIGNNYNENINPADTLAHQNLLDLNFDEPLKPIVLLEEDEYDDKSKPDIKVTNDNPKAYKFPPASSPLPAKPPIHSNTFASSPIKKNYYNSYSTKYLQTINNHDLKEYVDDIGPLLDDNNDENDNSTSFYDTSLKYVPIPVQEPKALKRSNQLPASYLPPPQPPTLSNGSPELNSSPEPSSPSPLRNAPQFYQDISPVHPQLKHANNFYGATQFHSETEGAFSNDLFYSDQLNSYSNQQTPTKQLPIQFQPNFSSQSYQLQPHHLQHQSPSSQLRQRYAESNQLNSSPIYPTATANKYFSSPIRNNYQDDLLDANSSQISALKETFPITPSKNQIHLEWSPIISPNVKASRDVKKHIEQSTPKKIKKTSLLPPGELDQYWDGPDGNKTYTCNFQNCGKKFTRRYNVRSHIQTHLSDRPFACSYCPKKFVRQHDLNRHIKGHTESKHCKCPCGKEFSRLDALTKHRERNICAGGLLGTNYGSITKPKIKAKNDFLDQYTSGKLTDQITSEGMVHYSPIHFKQKS